MCIRDLNIWIYFSCVHATSLIICMYFVGRSDCHFMYFQIYPYIPSYLIVLIIYKSFMCLLIADPYRKIICVISDMFLGPSRQWTKLNFDVIYITKAIGNNEE
jgi:hypothetical protein